MQQQIIEHAHHPASHLQAFIFIIIIIIIIKAMFMLLAIQKLFEKKEKKLQNALKQHFKVISTISSAYELTE